MSFCYNDNMPRLGLLATLRDTTFRSLRHRNYRRYFFGQIVSFVGSWMQSAALMWLLYDRTGDPRWPSWVLVAQVGPTVLLGTWGGGLADRLSRREAHHRHAVRVPRPRDHSSRSSSPST